ncbi:hypothetical protein Emed_002401 [Eimeria media]
MATVSRLLHIEGTTQPSTARRERPHFIQRSKKGSSTNEVTDLSAPSPFRAASSLRSKKIQRAALAAAALILSGFALLFICKRFSSNLTEAGLAHRKLAGNDDQEGASDEELDEILNQCLEFEAEHGEPPSDPDWEEPAKKKAKLVALLEEAAASHESEGLDSTIPAPGSHISPSWTQAAPSSGLQSADEVSTHEGFSLPGLDINPDLNPDGFLEQIPPLEEEQGEEGGEKGEPSVLPGDKDQEQPSTSIVVIDLVTPTPSPNPQQSALERHPFYRLPDIQPGAITRQPADVPAYTQNYFGTSYLDMVRDMRELFLLPSLGPKEVEELMSAAESLACYLLNHKSGGAGSVLSPSQGVRYLGQYFMMLDCLVCARQLVGPQMFSDETWQALTGSIDTRIYLLEPIKHVSPREQHNRDLLERLVPAMELMKAGGRPSAEEVVTIKRMLLCSEFLNTHFKDSRWNSWRQDDAQFAQMHQDSSDDSEDDKS